MKFRTNALGGVTRVGNTLVPESVSVERAGAGDAPDLVATFEVRDGRPECVHLAVSAKPGGRGIRLGDLDVFTTDEMAARSLMQFATPVGGGPLGGANERERWAMTADLHTARQRRRNPTSPITLERVADVYKNNVDRKPTRAVALALNCSDRTAARKVKQAEEAGLLPPTQPGKKRKV